MTDNNRSGDQEPALANVYGEADRGLGFFTAPDGTLQVGGNEYYPAIGSVEAGTVRTGAFGGGKSANPALIENQSPYGGLSAKPRELNNKPEGQ